MNKSKKSRKAGFTLAEVLITLGIIGVVAALTLPTLIKNYQKQVWVNQLKKAYSTLNNGFKQIVAEEGCTSLACYSPSSANINDCLDFSNKKTVEKIVSTFKLTNVEATYYIDSIYNYKCYNLSGIFTGTPFEPNSSNIVGTTPDGMILAISDCPTSIMVDLNGLKAPNTYGRDIFGFYFFDSNDSVIVAPWGSIQGTKYISDHITGAPLPSQEELINNINKSCSTDKNVGGGDSCAAKIIMDGWKMDY